MQVIKVAGVGHESHLCTRHRGSEASYGIAEHDLVRCYLKNIHILLHTDSWACQHTQLLSQWLGPDDCIQLCGARAQVNSTGINSPR